MNKERILKLVESIEKSETYNQSKYRNSDDSPASIAAHAIDLFRAEHRQSFEDRLKKIFDKVTRHSPYPSRRFVDDWEGYKTYFCNPFAESLHYLGLNQSQGVFLYALAPTEEMPTTADAVRTLKHLADTGEVVWKPS